MTAKQEAWYQSTLERMTRGSWEGLKSFTWCAACLGVSPEEAIADARTAGVKGRAADIRRGIATAQQNGAGVERHNTRRREARESPPIYTDTVRDYVRAGNGARVEDLAALAPSPFASVGPRATAPWLRALSPLRPEVLLFVTTKGARNGRLGVNIHHAGDLVYMAEKGLPLGGDLITPNPLTGRECINGEGRPSLICAGCLAPLPPFYVLEFDELSEADQMAFWAGFLRHSPLASNLVSLVHSGGRSIHGLLADFVPDPFTRESHGQTLRRLFASDPEARTIEEDGKRKEVYPFRADCNALHPLTKTRIPGAVRLGAGTVQRLLYFNPAAADRAF